MGGTADDDGASTFRLLVVPGVNPAKWLRTWSERLPDVPLELVHAEVADQVGVLVGPIEGPSDDGAHAGLVRLPLSRDDVSAIPLYTEATVVVVPRGHLLTALGDGESATPLDLADETLLVPDDDVLGWADAPGGRLPAEHTPATTAAAVELVAAGTGVLVVPQSLARLHHRKDVTAVPLTGAPTSTVALAWVTERHDAFVEEMVGIVRGRTVNSSRGTGTPSGDARAKETPAAAAGRGARTPRPTPRGTVGRGSAGGRGSTGGASRPRRPGGRGR